MFAHTDNWVIVVTHKQRQFNRYVRRWQLFRAECTGSLPTSEVKRRRVRLVLGWGIAREDLRVLPAFCCQPLRHSSGVPTHAHMHVLHQENVGRCLFQCPPLLNETNLLRHVAFILIMFWPHLLLNYPII